MLPTSKCNKLSNGFIKIEMNTRRRDGERVEGGGIAGKMDGGKKKKKNWKDETNKRTKYWHDMNTKYKQNKKTTQEKKRKRITEQ